MCGEQGHDKQNCPKQYQRDEAKTDEEDDEDAESEHEEESQDAEDDEHEGSHTLILGPKTQQSLQISNFTELLASVQSKK
ncbi:unnamed protein product [Calypogeia fissa]